MLTSAQRKYLAVEHVILPFVGNFVFNAVLAWYLSPDPLPMWGPLWGGEPSMSADLLGMLFFLPFFTCLMGAPWIEWQVRRSKVAKLRIRPDEHWMLRYQPRSLLLRSIWFGVVCTVALAPPTLGVLACLGFDAWSLSASLLFKSVYAGALSVLMTPPMALYSMSRYELAAPEFETAKRDSSAPQAAPEN